MTTFIPLPATVKLSHQSANYGGFPGGGTPDNLYETTNLSLSFSHMTMGAGLFLQGGGSIVNSTLTMLGQPGELVNPGHLDITRNSTVTCGELAGNGSIAVSHSTLNVTKAAIPYYPGGMPTPGPPQTGETITLTSAHLNIGNSSEPNPGMRFLGSIEMDPGSTITLKDTHATFEAFWQNRNTGTLDLFDGKTMVANLTVHVPEHTVIWARNVGSTVVLTAA